MLDFPVLFLIVSSESIQILWQLTDLDTKLTILINDNGLISHHGFQFRLKMPHFDDELLFNDRFFNINRVFNWNLHLDFNDPFNFNRLVNVDRFIDVDRHLDDFSYGNFDSFHDLFNNFHRNFFFNLNVLRDLDNFFHHPFRTWDWLRNLYNHFNWLFNNNFLDDLFRNSWPKTTNFIFSIFQQFSQKINIDLKLISISFELIDDLVMLSTSPWPSLEVLKLKAQSNSFLLRLFQLIL